MVVVASNQWKKKTTLGSRLDAREVEEGADGSKHQKNFLQLAFGHEEGGGGGRHVKIAERSISDSRLDVRGVEKRADRSKQPKKIHLRLTFGCKGGGTGGRCIEQSEKSTSGSCLDAREVVVVALWVYRALVPPVYATLIYQYLRHA